jgi:hypothetical protein
VGEGITIFDQKKYQSGAISSFKLNEVFGYCAKTLPFNLFEVFEPKADARNIIYKGLKKSQLLPVMSSKANHPYDLRIIDTEQEGPQSHHQHKNSKGCELDAFPRASAASGQSGNTVHTVNTNFYSNFTNTNSNSNSHGANSHNGQTQGATSNKLLIPSNNLAKARR